MKMKGVRCIDTGEEWLTVGKCAASIGYPSNSLILHLDQELYGLRQTLGGRMYERIHVPDKDDDLWDPKRFNWSGVK